jgi:phosphatidate cytidylyltransferase
MIQRVASAAVLLPLVLLSIFYLPQSLFLLLVDVFLGLAVFELLRLLNNSGLGTYWLTLPLTLLLPWIWSFDPGKVLPYLVSSGLLCMSLSLLHKRELHLGFLRSSGNFMVLFFLGVPLSIAAELQNNRPLELAFILFVIWTADTGAYLVGKKWGRHKVTPRLSPNKSLEGYVSGLLLSALAALLFGLYFFPDWSTVHLGFVGIFLGTLGATGDLFESMIKRGANLKDSSQLIPGHGGVMDRIDSLLFALPAYYLFSLLIK